MYPQGRKTLFARVFDSRAECAKGFHQLPDRSFLHTRTAGEQHGSVCKRTVRREESHSRAAVIHIDTRFRSGVVRQ